MGCAGIGYWYLDSINLFGGVPTSTLYISPARLTPDEDDAGRLVGYWLDYRRNMRQAVHFTLEEIIAYPLEPADDGFVPVGLVDTALAKANLARLGDAHAASSLSSGGRRPGIYHPPAGGGMPEDVYEGLKRDLRSIVELPDSAKRSMILKGPVEFDPTDQTVSELQLTEIMAMTRDDIFGLWGVPKSQLGYGRDAVIGGTSVDLDAETMWRNAAGPRLDVFRETFQTQYLDRYQKLGIELSIHFDTPEFDDEAPLYEMAQKAQVVPMRDSERRALIGLEPFGDPLLDDRIHMPINIEVREIAPPADPGDTQMGKARGPLPVMRLKDALADFLREQAERIGAKLERNSGHLAAKPRDVDAWWAQHEEDDALLAVLKPYITDAALTTGSVARSRFAGARGKAEMDMTAVLTGATLRRLAARVRGINQTTRDRIRDLVVEGIDAGLSPAEVGRGLRGTIPPLPDDAVGQSLARRLGDFGSELRAETIARTEMRVAQNAAQIDSFTALGATQVELIDGDEDAACAARNGRIVSMDEAESEMLSEHPNGTLTFAPVVGGDEFVGKAAPMQTWNIDIPAPVVHVNVDIPPTVVNVDVPPTVVNVEPNPATVVPAPVVNVAAPIVNVPVQPAPVVNVPAPIVNVEAPVGKAAEMVPVFVANWPEPKEFVVKRDSQGHMTRVEEV
jgi:hypothetical protein